MAPHKAGHGDVCFSGRNVPYLGSKRHSIVQRARIGPCLPSEEQAWSSHEHYQRDLQPGREPNPSGMHRRRDRALRRAQPPLSRSVLELHDAQQPSGGSSPPPVGPSLHFPRHGQHRLSLGPPQHQVAAEAIQEREHLRERLQCRVLARRQADGLRDPRGSPDRRHLAPQHLRRFRQHAQAALFARVPAGIDAVLGAVAPEAEPDNRGDAQWGSGVSVRSGVQRARRGDGGGPDGGREAAE
ncbi:uncharacterized protein [Blastocystis hominis]|uniref:Uncharacterized protein n=1 Tax=Blastocystis hominis TaxID=12968 RepID=D8LX17_BLAHO|nr:uncharacterized protein [Blastocystis hominis]CBK20812.2 unnamed protein product [Blastocystis hominis]|eukprot:XP_012894860.1 uncharacterized protein [Blastocystis hominis]